MTNETKHTPTPWKAEHNDHYWTIVPESRSENDPYQIGDVCSSYPGEMNQGLQQANATHIVKCVNMHDELVEVLSELMKVYNEPDEEICCNGYHCGCQGATVRQQAEHYASEALKKAGAL